MYPPQTYSSEAAQYQVFINFERTHTVWKPTCNHHLPELSDEECSPTSNNTKFTDGWVDGWMVGGWMAWCINIDGWQVGWVIVTSYSASSTKWWHRDKQTINLLSMNICYILTRWSDRHKTQLAGFNKTNSGVACLFTYCLAKLYPGRQVIDLAIQKETCIFFVYCLHRATTLSNVPRHTQYTITDKPCIWSMPALWKISLDWLGFIHIWHVYRVKKCRINARFLSILFIFWL